MRYVYCSILFIFSILAFYYATRIFYGKNYKKSIHRAFSITSLGSGLWSLGYALMLYVEDEQTFLFSRALGIIGLFMFILSTQVMIQFLSGKKNKNHYGIAIEAFFTVIVTVLVLRPGSVRIEYTDKGLVTIFNDGFTSIIYTVFTVLLAVGFVTMSLGLASKKNRRSVRAFGHNLLKVEGLIIFGMIIDTVLPALGVNFNIPASTIIQFIGLEIIYRTLHLAERNKISIRNLTGYIYESMKLPVLVFDSDNKAVIVNKEAGKVFELDPSVKVDEIDFWKDYFNETAPSDFENEQKSIELEVAFEKKQMTLLLNIDPIYDEYGDYLGYIVMVSDMTAYYKHTKELEVAKNEAMAANRAKSAFLANMSHEIRTPMNSILGFSELGLQSDIDDTSRGYLQDIHGSAENLLGVINDILDISKIESGKMELVNVRYELKELLEDVNRIMAMHASKKDLKYITDIDYSVPNLLYGDSLKIRAVLINLLNNAVKYTKTGSITLKLNYERTDDPSGKKLLKLIVKVIDTGIGIKKEELGKVFDSFRRVDESNNRNTEGTGLGLSITKGFVELMEGSISLESEYGKGSVFTAEMIQEIVDDTPISSSASKEKNATNRAIRFKDINVLSVDDNKINLKLLRLLMDKCELKIDEADSGEKAIEACRNKDYDIVFMDQMMPVMDGVETMKEIRKMGGAYAKDSRCRIIALTANAIDGTKEELIGEGFDEYLSKPIVFEKLIEIMCSILPESKWEILN